MRVLKANIDRGGWRPSVVLLYGPPACGKLTIAKELAKSEQLFLLDNHHFNDVVMPFVEINSSTLPDINAAVYQIRSLALNVIKKHKKSTAKGFIFSNVLLETPDDVESVEELKQFAQDIDGIFVPVHITCREDILLKRVGSEDRRQKFKLTDAGILKSFLENQRMIDFDCATKLDIDTSDISVDQAVQQIKNHIQNLSDNR